MVAMMSQKHYKEITKLFFFANHDITLMTSLIFEQQIVFYDITQEQQIVFDFKSRKGNKTNIFLININLIFKISQQL